MPFFSPNPPRFPRRRLRPRAGFSRPHLGPTLLPLQCLRPIKPYVQEAHYYNLFQDGNFSAHGAGRRGLLAAAWRTRRGLQSVRASRLTRHLASPPSHIPPQFAVACAWVARHTRPRPPSARRAPSRCAPRAPGSLAVTSRLPQRHRNRGRRPAAVGDLDPTWGGPAPSPAPRLLIPTLQICLSMSCLRLDSPCRCPAAQRRSSGPCPA